MFKQVVGEDGKKYPYVLFYDDDYGTRSGRNEKATFIVNADNAVVVEASFFSTFTIGNVLEIDMLETMGGIYNTTDDEYVVAEHVKRFKSFIDREKRKSDEYVKFINNLPK